MEASTRTSDPSCAGPLLAFLVLGSSCVAHDVTSAASAKSVTKSDWDVGLKAFVESEYSSNPFHYSDSDLEDFDNEMGSFQRFEGLEEEWDVITEAQFGITGIYEIDKGRDFATGLTLKNHLFLNNSIGNYDEIEGELGVNLTSNDKLNFSFEHTPDRFKRNYRAPSGLFFEGRYRQNEWKVEYERELTNDWAASAGVELYDRAYNHTDQTAFLASRDRYSQGVFVASDYDVLENLRIGAEVFLGDVDTGVQPPAGMDPPRDRSFETLRITPVIRTKLGRWRFFLSLDFREKKYTTVEAADTGRFGRVDDRITARIEARRKIGWHKGQLRFHVGWSENDSDIEDSDQIDEPGYEEITIGAELRFSL